MQDYVFVVNCERVKHARGKYNLRFPINDQLINRIKELPEDTRKWNKEVNAWEINALSLYNLILHYKKSNKIFFKFIDDNERNIFIDNVKKFKIIEEENQKKILDLKEKKEYWVRYKNELENNFEKYSDIVHKNLKPNVRLYPHQIIGTMFLSEVKNALLALDMGTGKTLISISYVEMNKFDKVFVITPNSLKYNYKIEVEKYTNSKAFIIGKKNDCTINEAKYIIVNYEYFNPSSFTKVKNKFDKLNIGKIDCLILDESHRISSSKSNTYKNYKKLFKDDIFKNKQPSKIFMSGTPAVSRAYEMYNVLHQISPLDFPTQKYYYEYYCGMKYNLDGWGWETNIGSTKFEELFIKISPFTYRKKKSDVLKDLPEKTYQKIYLEMTPEEYEIYSKLEEGVANEFFNEDVFNPLSKMGKLREYTSHLKVTSVKELIDSILESGEKFVIVDFYKESLNRLYNIYEEICALHTGDQKDIERAEIVKDFQNENGKIKLFLGSEGTTKEGLTLTAANKIGILTIPWTPGTLDQISDRLNRIGQKNAVNVYIFVYKDSIDEYVFNLIESKRSEISKVIDGSKYESDVNQGIINELVEIIKNKYKK